MSLLRSPTALRVRGGYSRRGSSASPAVRYLGQSTSLIRVLDTKWKHSGSISRWLRGDQWRLYKPANHRQSGAKLAWRQVSVHSGISHVWRTQQVLQCHSNRSVHTISTHQFCWSHIKCWIALFDILICNQHMKWWISQWYEVRKSGLIIFFLLTCRKDPEVPTDAYDSRAGGSVPYCTSCGCVTVGQNYKGNTQNTRTYSTKTDPDSLQTEPPNASFLFWQCCRK